MVRIMHVVVFGGRRVGKTALLRNLALMDDDMNQKYYTTVDDTFTVQMDTADRPKEIMMLHDTAGLEKASDVNGIRSCYLQVFFNDFLLRRTQMSPRWLTLSCLCTQRMSRSPSK